MITNNKIFGLVGCNISHTFSPEIHACFGDYNYQIFDLPKTQAADFIRNGDYSGINVTIPYKKAAFELCDKLSSSAQQIGAVNTIVQEKGRLSGFNTDYEGFGYMSELVGVSFFGKKVVIAGSGGACAAAKAFAGNQGAKKIIIVSRGGKNNYDNISAHYDADVFINTTPLGSVPFCDSVPVDISCFKQCRYVLDVVYNPLRTRLVCSALVNGKKAVGGLSMLVGQAAYAAQHFINDRISAEKTAAVLKTFEKSKKNIVLTGMPSCGKTTVGKVVAEKLGRDFYDTDDMISEKLGITPGELIVSGRESELRKAEAEVVESLRFLNGKVISVGGGVVLNEENMFSLMGNGCIYLIKKDLSQLNENHPAIKKAGGAAVLYEQRSAIYEKYSDVVIDKNNSYEVCNEICRDFC